jgi:transglutaminase-like putative cysteine protease
MDRRTFLGLTAALPAAVAVGAAPRWVGAAGEPKAGERWRTFEVTTRVEVAGASGVTKAWLPLPLTADTDYQKGLGQSWTGNPKAARVVQDPKYGAGIFYAEWAEGEAAPVVELTSRFATRDRAVDPRSPGAGLREDKAALARYLESTELIRTDGIVEKTAREITKGSKTDLDKAHAIYEWIVENTFRDPKVRGCGVGDIRGMLETGNLGGKCADLNALFVGLARAVGIPARDVYGVRVADSAEYKSLGRSGDITRAQHCRAEFYLAGQGWIPVDPADVRKLVLEERGGIPLSDPLVKQARGKLFGAWEMNWLAYNYAHDVKLPQSAHGPVAFLMYPQAETAGARLDSLDPDRFRYKMTSRELGA